MADFPISIHTIQVVWRIVYWEEAAAASEMLIRWDWAPVNGVESCGITLAAIMRSRRDEAEAVEWEAAAAGATMTLSRSCRRRLLARAAVDQRDLVIR